LASLPADGVATVLPYQQERCHRASRPVGLKSSGEPKIVLIIGRNYRVQRCP
jgi:hypothetical protein